MVGYDNRYRRGKQIIIESVLKDVSEAGVIVEAWYTAEYEGGRHQRRIDMITAIEEENRND